jgi:2,4-dienoyl-CoA reductase (NADPH2)
VSIPLITTNRINTPEVAEEVLASASADMVSMARPFLADADFVNKAAANKATRSTPASPATRPAWTTFSTAS